MFTGIVEAIGEVRSIEDDGGGLRIEIGAPFDDLTSGQSVSLSGTCLTVEEFEPGEWFSVFLARETLARTSFEDLSVGDCVNLERAMAADGRFDGHIVQGHVDGTAEIAAIESVGEDWTYTFTLPQQLTRYVVEKGSITVDGISLTVADRDAEGFSVAIIPTTYDETVLSERDVGDTVHLEVDVIAKYVERMVQGSNSDSAGL